MTAVLEGVEEIYFPEVANTTVTEFRGLNLPSYRITKSPTVTADDGYIDSIAVDIWVEGIRREIPFPRINSRERWVVIGLLYRRGASSRDIQKYLDDRGMYVPYRTVTKILERLGLMPPSRRAA